MRFTVVIDNCTAILGKSCGAAFLSARVLPFPGKSISEKMLVTSPCFDVIVVQGTPYQNLDFYNH